MNVPDALREAEREAKALIATAPLYCTLAEAVDAYRDAVAAEARAALLADAPEVWVATDAGHYVSFLHLRKPEEWSGQFAVTHHRSMGLDAQITPPGACVRYRLVPDPEET